MPGSQLPVQTPNPGTVGDVTFVHGSADPSAGAGVTATAPAVYVRDNGDLWVKTGAADTAWTRVGSSGSGTTLVVKSVLQSKSNNAIALDSELFATIASGTKLKFKFVIYASQTGGVGGIQLQLGGSVGSSGALLAFVRVFKQNATDAVAVTESMITSLASIVNANAGGDANLRIEIEGVWSIANLGTFGLKWAQITSDANLTVVQAQSFMEYYAV